MQETFQRSSQPPGTNKNAHPFPFACRYMQENGTKDKQMKGIQENEMTRGQKHKPKTATPKADTTK